MQNLTHVGELLPEKSCLNIKHMHTSSWAQAPTQSEPECWWERLLVQIVAAAVEGLLELPDERKNDDSLHICEHLGDCHKQVTEHLSFM